MTIPTFEATGPLPTGTTVLEASAGTGKTWTIAALATRYLADGIGLDRLLLVTFSRAATKELRVRVRSRLVETEAALRAHLDEPDHPIDDPIVRLLTEGGAEAVRERADRLAAALDEFDDATISTIHEFCSRMIDGLGVLARSDPGRVFTESLADLTDEVTADAYLRLHADRDRAVLDPTTARSLAQQVIAHPQCQLVPEPDSPECEDAVVAARVEFAAAVRTEVRRRQHLQRLVTHDDMLTELRDSLADPVTGADAVELLRAQYSVVLVDEFQDTDPVQWEIVHRAFHDHATLILIGDPKQAIYAFRGADVYAYLDAVVAAGGQDTLTTNWRSDRPMVEAVDHLFAGAALGDPRIVVRPVTASHPARIRTAEGTAPAPVRLRALAPEGEDDPSVAAIRPVIRRDLVQQIGELLRSGSQLNIGTEDEPVWRGVQPRDIAVLVNKNATAAAVVTDLVSAGIPAVETGGSSIFAQPMAQHWLTVLQALADPRAGTIRRAALTPMLGWDFTRLATADETAMAELSTTIHRWARVADEFGIAALTETLLESDDLPVRLLSHEHGDRQVTDLRHLGQLLHHRMSTHHLGVPALTEWLDDSIRRAARTNQDDQHRRLETDAEAVQVLTVHRAKGLEFGIVLLPEAWDRAVLKDNGWPLQFHGEVDRIRAETAGAPSLTPPPVAGPLVLDVGGSAAPGRRDRRDRARFEDAGDELRQLYVALTRARHQVITWWAPSYNTDTSPLHRVLYGPRTPGTIPPERAPRPAPPDTLGLDASLVQVETVEMAQVPAVTRIEVSTPGLDPSTLRARRWNRHIDTEWRRTSYSALTAAAHEHGPADRGNDELGVSDEPDTLEDPAEIPVVTQEPAAEMLSPMGELPAGTEFGTIMHAIYEHADATADDLQAELRSRTAAELARTPYPVTAEVLADALVPAFETPLGPIASGLRLRDFGVADRLSELDFELPLAGGDRPTGARVRVADLAAVLAEHVGDHPHLHAYPAMLASEPTGEQTLRGYLTGSIDSVLRVRDDAGGPPRHLVVDYKSNWLGEFGVPLTVASYHPDRVAEAMMRAHYPLQALLYSVALHRFLSWRMPDYDPATHLGGIAYLFVRGMAGPDTPTVDQVPYGVFSWDPGPDLVIAWSQLLAGEGA